MARGNATLFIVLLVNTIAFGLVTPFLPLLAEHAGLNGRYIGWLMAIYFAMQLIFTPVIGRLSDRFGRTPLLVVSLLGTAVGLLIISQARTAAALFLGRIIDGITGGSVSLTQAYISDNTHPNERSRSMQIITVAFGVGLAVGPFVGAFATRLSIHAPFTIGSILAGGTALLVYSTLGNQATSGHAESNAVLANGSILFLFFSYLCLATALSTVTTLFPLLCERRFNYTPDKIGLIFGFFGFTLALSQITVVRQLLKVFGDSQLALSGLVIMAFSIVTLAHIRTLPILLVSSGMLALGDGLATPTLTSLASKRGHSSAHGRSLGYLQGLGAVGRFLGPILAGNLMTADGTGRPEITTSSIWAAAVICILGALGAAFIRAPTAVGPQA
jgi:MFS family permease